jgi:chloramphenicol-sensitive protein RarD
MVIVSLNGECYMHTMNKGALSAIVAYTLWGLLPIYWKWLRHVPANQVLCHRILWSFITLFVIILVSRQGRAFRAAIADLRVLRTYAVAAVLISINWLTYIWAVNAGFIVETSLGYFINPLLSVLLGVVFFHERLRPWQWAAITLATTGVVYLTYIYGSLPWIALTLAATFGMYGMVKKAAPLKSLQGLALETLVLLVPAIMFLVYSHGAGNGALFHNGAISDALLMGAGIITAVPLLLFSSAARRIPLSLMGILQYISPTLQFLLGVLIYKEHFTTAKFMGFGIVWAGLIIYGVEGLLVYRAQSFPVVSE